MEGKELTPDAVPRTRPIRSDRHDELGQVVMYEIKECVRR
jgi:hypothetical protein